MSASNNGPSREDLFQYMKERRELYDKEKRRPRPLPRRLIQNKISTLKEARDIFSKIESHFPRRMEKGRSKKTLDDLNLAIDYLSALTSPGRIQDLTIPATVFFLAELYIAYTGKPHYREIGELMGEYFADAVPEGCDATWARITATRYRATIEELGDQEKCDATIKRLSKSSLLESLRC